MRERIETSGTSSTRKGGFIDTTRSRTLRCASHNQNGDRLFGDLAGVWISSCNCDATAAAHEPWLKKRQLSFVECQGLHSASSSIATMPVSVVGTELFNGCCGSTCVLERTLCCSRRRRSTHQERDTRIPQWKRTG